MSDDEPIIAGRKSTTVELEPGTYYWCACGRSANQPFCDGSHKGTRFTPVKFELSERTTLKLCNCKRSAKGHICDGAHKKL